MPRHYTDDEKRLVLDRLATNQYDVGRTANEFNLPTTTIYRWMSAANVTKPVHSQLQQLQQLQHSASSSPLPEGEGAGVKVTSGEGLPPETLETFQLLHDQLLVLAKSLATRIEESIDEAPLNQRMTALSQLIASITKLAALLPKQEEEIQYIYEYEDEVEHHIEKKEAADENHSRKETQNQAED